jgi:hypothetical protein
VRNVELVERPYDRERLTVAALLHSYETVENGSPGNGDERCLVDVEPLSVEGVHFKGVEAGDDEPKESPKPIETEDALHEDDDFAKRIHSEGQKEKGRKRKRKRREERRTRKRKRGKSGERRHRRVTDDSLETISTKDLQRAS